MKLKLLGILLAFVTAAHGAPIVPDAQEAKAAHMAAELLSRYHYKPQPIDEALSGKIFDQYLKALDSDKLFFVQADIDQISEARTKLGSDLINDDLARPFAIFNLYVKRAVERFSYARSLLKTGFKFDSNETFQFIRTKQDWPKSEAEVQDLWRKRVKNDWLRLKLAGKSDKNIVEILSKRYDNSIKRIGKFNNEDAFNTYMNAYTMAIEPHTNYMAPRNAANFDISMRLSLVGIGAVLVEVDEYTTIRELVAGGPAALSGQLNVGDRIVGVAQGEKGPMTDVMGARLDDSVALIRGALDTVVRLEVLPADAGPDGKHKLVSLIRKPISLKDQSAKSSVQTITDGNITRNIGVITLPSFYEDFAAHQKGDTNYKSTSRDVAALIKELKAKKVDGILMDLRNNGGGSLAEAVELTGLFTGKGPVVQIRNAKGEIHVDSSTQPEEEW
ncbi:MAG: S41 family peptidase, partial [Rhodoferax sp.]